jgi:hypothetical protein
MVVWTIRVGNKEMSIGLKGMPAEAPLIELAKFEAREALRRDPGAALDLLVDGVSRGAGEARKWLELPE